jgi:hypothetical protein
LPPAPHRRLDRRQVLEGAIFAGEQQIDDRAIAGEGRDSLRLHFQPELHADVVGFSRLMSADETGTLAYLKAFRAELIEPKTLQYGCESATSPTVCYRRVMSLVRR